MKVSFIIPAYNEEKYLGMCLRSLQEEVHRYGSAAEHEIIVVDNASTDNTQAVAQQFPGVKVVYEPTKGLAQARQRGLQESRSTLIAYLDADMQILPGWVAAFMKEFETDPAVVGVSGPYIYYDLPWVWRMLAWPYEIVVGRITHFFTGYVVAGGNFIVKREALIKAGGYDVSIAFYGEDWEMAKRLKRTGKIVFTPAVALPSSARRFNTDGVLYTTAIYIASSLSVWARGRAARSLPNHDIR